MPCRSYFYLFYRHQKAHGLLTLLLALSLGRWALDATDFGTHTLTRTPFSQPVRLGHAPTLVPAPGREGPDVSGSVQVSRCLTLLSQDEGAATAFYARLHQHAGVPSAAKVIAMLVRVVLVAARAAEDGDQEEEEEEEGKVVGWQARAGGRKGKRKGLGANEGGGGRGEGAGGERTLKASDSKVRFCYILCGLYNKRGGGGVMWPWEDAQGIRL